MPSKLTPFGFTISWQVSRQHTSSMPLLAMLDPAFGSLRWAQLGLCFGLLLSLLSATVAANELISTPARLSQNHLPGDDFMGIRLRGTLALRTDTQPLHQLSDLLWDDDQQRLYALSDDAYLVHLAVHINDGMLSAVSLVASYPLLAPDGSPLTGKRADSEGLTARGEKNGLEGDTTLFISFEGVPRVARYSPTGQHLGRVALPADLASGDAYASSNRQLESVTDTARFGLLVAPERPLLGRSQTSIPIVSLQHHKRWRYPLRDTEYGAVVALETLANGELLVLERRFISLLHPLTITLARAAIPSADGGLLGVKDVAHFDTSKGWALDNFEGMARHQGACYFLVSDDNRNPLQRTLLTYLEIREPAVQSKPINARANVASAQLSCTVESDNRVDEQSSSPTQE